MIDIPPSPSGQIVSKFDEIRLFPFKWVSNSPWQPLINPAILGVIVQPIERGFFFFFVFLPGSTCDGGKNAQGTQLTLVQFLSSTTFKVVNQQRPSGITLSN